MPDVFLWILQSILGRCFCKILHYLCQIFCFFLHQPRPQTLHKIYQNTGFFISIFPCKDIIYDQRKSVFWHILRSGNVTFKLGYFKYFQSKHREWPGNNCFWDSYTDSCDLVDLFLINVQDNAGGQKQLSSTLMPGNKYVLSKFTDFQRKRQWQRPFIAKL